MRSGRSPIDEMIKIDRRSSSQCALSLRVICKNTRRSMHDLSALPVDIKKKDVINNTVCIFSSVIVDKNINTHSTINSVVRIIFTTFASPINSEINV